MLNNNGSVYTCTALATSYRSSIRRCGEQFGRLTAPPAELLTAPTAEPSETKEKKQIKDQTPTLPNFSPPIRLSKTPQTRKTTTALTTMSGASIPKA